MIYQSKDNPNAHLTVKERTSASLPAKALWERKLISGRVLDFGCGLGIDIEYLKGKGFDIFGYDPYYLPDIPEGKFDTIICNYVLNVLLPEEQSHVLMAISELLKPNGQAFYAVRRDIKRNGFLYNPKREAKTYQCNVSLPYISVFKTESCEIYQYQAYTELNKRKTVFSPFFEGDHTRDLITEAATVFAIFDKYPVSKGHALVIPKRNTSNYFDLSQREQTACWMVVSRVREILKNRFNPDGFNVGMNIGIAAGQTVEHVHIHVIPRYDGDVPEPRGGVRNVFAGKGDYSIKQTKTTIDQQR